MFEITSTDVGVFEVSGRFLGRQIEKVELVFQVCVYECNLPNGGLQKLSSGAYA